MRITTLLKRELSALRDATLATRKSYSQCGEDRLILNLLGSSRPTTHIYVDVGGNHPTRINNTYLFLLYRRGFRGIIIEPNIAFASLYRRYRPRDDFIPIGCSATPTLLPFYSGSISVLDSFEPKRQQPDTRTRLVPTLPLDYLRDHIGTFGICLLTIDTEGFDYQVLTSGTTLLSITDLVCIEQAADDPRIGRYLEDAGFICAGTTLHNSVFINKRHAEATRCENQSVVVPRT